MERRPTGTGVLPSSKKSKHDDWGNIKRRKKQCKEKDQDSEDEWVESDQTNVKTDFSTEVRIDVDSVPSKRENWMTDLFPKPQTVPVAVESSQNVSKIE